MISMTKIIFLLDCTTLSSASTVSPLNYYIFIRHSVDSSSHVYVIVMNHIINSNTPT